MTEVITPDTQKASRRWIAVTPAGGRRRRVWAHSGAALDDRLHRRAVMHGGGGGGGDSCRTAGRVRAAATAVWRRAPRGVGRRGRGAREQRPGVLLEFGPHREQRGGGGGRAFLFWKNNAI